MKCISRFGEQIRRTLLHEYHITQLRAKMTHFAGTIVITKM